MSCRANPCEKNSPISEFTYYACFYEKRKGFPISWQLLLLLILFLKKQYKIIFLLPYVVLKWDLSSENIFREQISQLFSN